MNMGMWHQGVCALREMVRSAQMRQWYQAMALILTQVA
ncbi:hypothetical protein AZ033_000563, partial [Klebsiella pneumoniae]